MPVGNEYTKRLRGAFGLKQTELAEQASVDARTISRFENGGIVTEETVIKIAEGLSNATKLNIRPGNLLVSDTEPNRLSANRSTELSDYARSLLELLNRTRDYGFGILQDETGISRSTLKELEKGDVHVDSKTAQKIINFIKQYLDNDSNLRLQTSFDPKTFADIIKRELSIKGISQRELAQKAQIEQTTLSRFLNGKSRPSTKLIDTLVRFLDLDDSELASLRFRSPSETEQPTRISIRLPSNELSRLQEIAAREHQPISRIARSSIGDGTTLRRLAKEGKLSEPAPSVDLYNEPTQSSDRKALTLSLSSDQAELLSQIARQVGTSRSEVMRSALLNNELLRQQEFDTGAWEQANPKTFNSDSPAEETRKLKMVQAAQSIPDQNPLVRFSVSENAKLNLIPTLADENDYDTIQALRSELLAIQGPIEHLRERYASNPNVPQAGLFSPLVSKYDEELSKNPKEINYTVLFARGSRFYAARRRASQQIAAGEWPELDADENEAIDAICDLHGPMIMASAAGRKLVEDAHQYEVPPEVYEEDQKIIQEFGEVIASEAELMEPETADAYRELTAKTEGDPQPARSRGLGIAATGSALTVIVGGAAWYGAGGAVATFIVPATAIGAAGLVGGFFWEAIKTMPRFKKATSAVGDQFEKALDQADKHADGKERALLKGMADLVERNRPLFEKVTELRPEFSWAKKFLVRRSPDEHESSALPKELKPSKHIVLMGPRGSGKSTIGKLLAERLQVGITDFEYQLTKRLEENPHAFRERAGEARYVERARDTLLELLAVEPSIIEFDLTSNDHEAILEPLKAKATVVFLSVDRDLNPNLLPSDLSGVKYLSINVSNLSKPEDIEEHIVRQLVKNDD